jgi:iron complex transport system permease protein
MLLSPKWCYAILFILLILSLFLGTGLGALPISPSEISGIFLQSLGIESGLPFEKIQASVLMGIRLPRVILGILIGTSLAISGASMQGLFRNPLADPGLIGISSGASFAAVGFIVMSTKILGALSGLLGIYALSAVTFLGALTSTILIYRLSLVKGRTDVAMMLLAGVGINAIAIAGTGVFTYAATESQLRSITFWTLGSLGGATWTNVLGILPFTLIAVLILPRMAKSLNAFALNESNAAHLGINTERVKRTVIVLSALCVGASVAIAGIIMFVGLIIPHIIRMIVGPDHRHLLSLSALAGAVLVMNADLIARTAFGPNELPIGILTSLVGGPFFIYLLLREKRSKMIM